MAKQMLMNTRLFCIAYNRSVAWLITQMNNHSVGALLLPDCSAYSMHISTPRFNFLTLLLLISYSHCYMLVNTYLPMCICMYDCVYKALSLIT